MVNAPEQSLGLLKSDKKEMNLAAFVLLMGADSLNRRCDDTCAHILV